MITREQALVERAKREKQRRKARENFWEYRQYINPNIKKGWFQEDVSNKLQSFYEDYKTGKRPKLVIQAPPQHGKSTLVIDFIAWISGKDPENKIIYASFSDRLGVRANLRLRRIFAMPAYQALFPNSINLNDSINQNIIEYSGHDGYFRNTTVNGAITGESLDLGVIDDPIKGRDEAKSETVRNKTWDWFTDDFFTRFSENAGLLSILTRWHVDDPIGRLIERMPDVKVASYPAIATKDETHRKKGEALFPEHHSLEFLLERKKGMFEANWEALYQQNPIISNGNIFKISELKTVDAIPAGNIQWVRGWDLASSLDGDYTAGARIGKLQDGRYIIADMARDRLPPDERDNLITGTASQDGRNTYISIPQDAGQAGKSLALYLTRQLAGYRVKTSPETGDKVTRAQPFASQVNVGNVLILRGSWNTALIEEMRMFPNGAHDDQIDAMSRAFAEFVTGRKVLRLA